MAADVEIRELNGVSPGTPTVKTSGTIRFKNADDANVDLNDPIVRPGSGTNYSYWKVIRLYIDSPGPTGSITSPRAFSDSTPNFGTDVTMKAGGRAAYLQPANTDISSEGSWATTPDDFFGFTSGSPLALDVGNPPGGGGYTGTTTYIADFLVMQAAVGTGASPGLTPSETLTIAYDET